MIHVDSSFCQITLTFIVGSSSSWLSSRPRIRTQRRLPPFGVRTPFQSSQIGSSFSMCTNSYSLGQFQYNQSETHACWFFSYFSETITSRGGENLIKQPMLSQQKNKGVLSLALCLGMFWCHDTKNNLHLGKTPVPDDSFHRCTVGCFQSQGCLKSKKPNSKQIGTCWTTVFCLRYSKKWTQIALNWRENEWNFWPFSKPNPQWVV